jgi:hypothetical protein
MSTKIFKSAIEFIDPVSCGSTVGYKVVIQKSTYNGESSIYGSIELTDCNRRISWDLNSDDGGREAVDKIGNAIRLLTDARYAIIEANKRVAAANRRNQKENEKEGKDANAPTPSSD